MDNAELSELEQNLDELDWILKCIETSEICERCVEAKAEGILDNYPLMKICSEAHQTLDSLKPEDIAADTPSPHGTLGTEPE